MQKYEVRMLANKIWVGSREMAVGSFTVEEDSLDGVLRLLHKDGLVVPLYYEIYLDEDPLKTRPIHVYHNIGGSYAGWLVSMPDEAKRKVAEQIPAFRKILRY